jgi:hypothetical protein
MEPAGTSTRRASAAVLFALVAFLFAGCSRDTSSVAGKTPEAASTSAQHVPPPPDVGDIGHFHQCRQRPQHELNPYQSCLAERLGAAQCTPAVDCVLTCLASPTGETWRRLRPRVLRLQRLPRVEGSTCGNGRMPAGAHCRQTLRT